MTEHGCKMRKCPCRMWVNCFNYVDKRRQEWRLKKKEGEHGLRKWYDDSFREEMVMVDIFSSG